MDFLRGHNRLIDFAGNREEWVSAVLAAYQVQGRVQWFKVQGRSMRPLLREGDEIQVRFVSPKTSGGGTWPFIGKEGS